MHQFDGRYVSSDFGNHPLSHLMGSVFGMHNRSHIEVCTTTQHLSTTALYKSSSLFTYCILVIWVFTTMMSRFLLFQWQCGLMLMVYVMQVFCYALSQSDGSEWRQRISTEAEHFVDVSAMASDTIAHMICDDKIQILVNLNGYTKVPISLSFPFT